MAIFYGNTLIFNHFKFPASADPARVCLLRRPVDAGRALRVVVAPLLHRPHDHHGRPLRPHGTQGQVKQPRCKLVRTNIRIRPGL